MAGSGWPKGLSRKEYYALHPKVDEEPKHRGKKSMKSDEERFCPSIFRDHGMFGCHKRSDKRLFPSACTITNETGCQYSEKKRTRKVKEVAE